MRDGIPLPFQEESDPKGVRLHSPGAAVTFAVDRSSGRASAVATLHFLRRSGPRGQTRFSAATRRAFRSRIPYTSKLIPTWL